MKQSCEILVGKMPRVCAGAARLGLPVYLLCYGVWLDLPPIGMIYHPISSHRFYHDPVLRRDNQRPEPNNSTRQRKNRAHQMSPAPEAYKPPRLLRISTSSLLRIRLQLNQQIIRRYHEEPGERHHQNRCDPRRGRTHPGGVVGCDEEVEDACGDRD